MIKKNIAISTLLIALVTSACQSNYQISTNIDKENFQQYFSPSKVTIYQNESEFPNLYKYLGLVEGEDCQAQAHLAEPNKINARTNARGNAFQQGANAIIFTGCALIDNSKKNTEIPSNNSKQCNAVIVCYGKAYSIATTEETDKKQESEHEDKHENENKNK